MSARNQANKKGPSIVGGSSDRPSDNDLTRSEFGSIHSAHKEISASGGAAVKYDDIVKVMAKKNPVAKTNRKVGPNTFDDWESFVAGMRKGKAVLLVNASPVRKRQQTNGEVDVEAFYEFQFYYEEIARHYTVAFLSEGKEGLQVRQNQKKYHPEQMVYAIDCNEKKNQERLKGLRDQLLKDGKGKMDSSAEFSTPGADFSSELAAGVVL